jgi:hypothetical protein
VQGSNHEDCYLHAAGLPSLSQLLGMELVIMATNVNVCHTDEESKYLNTLPWLANPLLKFDLSQELQEFGSLLRA